MSPSIHPEALAYERSRPGYPAEAVDALVAALPARDVIDLAAGTGKLTRDLLARGLDVVAVEPRAELRAAIEPPARVLEGIAEAIPLPGASADGVVIAQAFHLFASPAVLAEIHRVLRPGGVLALLWNRRLPVGAHVALEQLLAPVGDPAHASRDRGWRSAFDGDRLFDSLHTQCSTTSVCSTPTSSPNTWGPGRSSLCSRMPSVYRCSIRSARWPRTAR